MTAHEQRIRVYYADTDQTGVVYHANYLALAERGRVDALHEAGAPVASLEREHGLLFLVRDANLAYVRPLRLDDTFILSTGSAGVSGASARIRHNFLLEGALTTRVTVTLVCVRRQDWRPTRIPGRWRDALVGLAIAAEGGD